MRENNGSSHVGWQMLTILLFSVPSFIANFCYRKLIVTFTLNMDQVLLCPMPMMPSFKLIQAPNAKFSVPTKS